MHSLEANRLTCAEIGRMVPRLQSHGGEQTVNLQST